MFVRMCVCALCVRVCSQALVCMYVCVRVCVCVCMWACVCIHVRTAIETATPDCTDKNMGSAYKPGCRCPVALLLSEQTHSHHCWQ